MIADDFPAIALRLKELSAKPPISDDFLPRGWLMWKPLEEEPTLWVSSS